MNIIKAFKRNQITLNEARIGLGLPPDSLFGHKYYFELLTFMSYEVKAQTDPIFGIFYDQLSALQSKYQIDFSNQFKEILQKWRTNVNSQPTNRPFARGEKKRFYEYVENMYSDLEKEIMETHREVMAKLVEEAGSRMTETVIASDEAYDKEHFVDNELESLSEQFAAYVMEKYKNKIKEFYNRAENLITLRDEILKFIDDAKKDEKTINYEMVKISNLAAEDAMRQAGIEEKMWVLEDHSRSCPFCRRMSEENKKVGEPFAREGDIIQIDDKVMNIKEDVLAPPIHANCACFIMPVGIESPYREFTPATDAEIEQLRQLLIKWGIRADVAKRWAEGNKYPKIHKNAGQVSDKKNANGAYEVINYKGEKISLTGREYYGKTKKVVIGNDETGYKEFNVQVDKFPDFTPFKYDEFQLAVRHYQIPEKRQFHILNIMVRDKIDRDQKYRAKLLDLALNTIKYGGSKNRLCRKYRAFFDNSGIKSTLQQHLPHIQSNVLEAYINKVIRGEPCPELYKEIVARDKLKQDVESIFISWVEKGNEYFGFTWHHHEELGRMLLLPSNIHTNVPHTGGEAIYYGNRHDDDEETTVQVR